MSLVLLEQRGHALWITINREERRNAMNEAVMAGMGRASRARPRTHRCAPSC